MPFHLSVSGFPFFKKAHKSVKNLKKLGDIRILKDFIISVTMKTVQVAFFSYVPLHDDFFRIRFHAFLLLKRDSFIDNYRKRRIAFFKKSLAKNFWFLSGYIIPLFCLTDGACKQTKHSDTPNENLKTSGERFGNNFFQRLCSGYMLKLLNKLLLKGIFFGGAFCKKFLESHQKLNVFYNKNRPKSHLVLSFFKLLISFC